MLFHIVNLEKVEKAVSETECLVILVSFRFIKMNTPIASKLPSRLRQAKNRQPTSLMNSAGKT